MERGDKVSATEDNRPRKLLLYLRSPKGNSRRIGGQVIRVPARKLMRGNDVMGAWKGLAPSLRLALGQYITLSSVPHALRSLYRLFFSHCQHHRRHLPQHNA